jgi:hypothetical protein
MLGIQGFRDLGIQGFRDLGIQGFRNLGIEGILSLLIYRFYPLISQSLNLAPKDIDSVQKKLIHFKSKL